MPARQVVHWRHLWAATLSCAARRAIESPHSAWRVVPALPGSKITGPLETAAEEHGVNPSERLVILVGDLQEEEPWQRQGHGLVQQERLLGSVHVHVHVACECSASVARACVVMCICICMWGASSDPSTSITSTSRLRSASCVASRHSRQTCSSVASGVGCNPWNNFLFAMSALSA